MTMIKFELLSESRIDEITELERQCFPGDEWTRQMFMSELNNGLSLFITGIDEETDAVVCYGGVWIIADTAEVTNIAVAPEFRRIGLGGHILTLLTDICRERGAEVINLEVRRGNTAAAELYKKHGFRTVGCRRGYYKDGSDAELMTKELQR